VLLKSFGFELMQAGLWKLLWSVCVIMGAFFFVRTLQFHVNGHAEVSNCLERCSCPASLFPLSFPPSPS
jgi:hypothetical protein